MKAQTQGGKRHPELEATEKLIWRAVRGFGQKTSKEFRRRYVLAHWEDIVGRTIARKVHAVAIRDKTLYLYTYEPVWANQVRMMMPEIIAKANGFMHEPILKDIRFTRRRGEVAEKGTGGAAEEKPRNFARELQKMPVGEEELEKARQLAATVSDPDLSKKILALAIKSVQMKKWKTHEGYHPCALCGELVEKDRTLCPACRRKEASDLHMKVRRVLREMPWARCKDVEPYVPGCTPKLLNEERSFLVQQMAASIPADDTESLAAKTLVMLARSMPPEALTERIIKETLYRLRADMFHPKGYKYPKRYEALPLAGKSGWKKGR